MATKCPHRCRWRIPCKRLRLHFVNYLNLRVCWKDLETAFFSSKQTTLLANGTAFGECLTHWATNDEKCLKSAWEVWRMWSFRIDICARNVTRITVLPASRARPNSTSGFWQTLASCFHKLTQTFYVSWHRNKTRKPLPLQTNGCDCHLFQIVSRRQVSSVKKQELPIESYWSIWISMKRVWNPR